MQRLYLKCLLCVHVQFSSALEPILSPMTAEGKNKGKQFITGFGSAAPEAVTKHIFIGSFFFIVKGLLTAALILYFSEFSIGPRIRVTLVWDSAVLYKMCVDL